MADSPASIPVRVLTRLAQVIYRRRSWFILPQLLLAAACIWYTVARLEFSVDRNDLVGSDQEYHRNFLELKREFPAQDDLVAIIESDDPEKNPHAILYREIDYDTVMEKNLKVMDSTAIAQCRTHKLPILVFNFKKVGNIVKAVSGQKVGTRISPRSESGERIVINASLEVLIGSIRKKL